MPRAKVSPGTPVETKPAAPKPPTTASKETAATALDAIEGVGRAAAGKGPRPKPWSVEPKMGRSFEALVEIIVPEQGIDIEAEYAELDKVLQIEGALTPAVVREHLNAAEKRAMRAHRLFVSAKLEARRFELDCEEALGAMREEATSELQAEKNKGERNKSITEADVRGRAATLHPDEWASINGQLERAKRTIAQLEHFSDLWKGRRFSLSALLGDGR